MSKDLFGNEIEEVQDDDYVPEKHKKTSPFDFIGSVSETKKDLIEENPEVENDYAAYIINRGLGYFPDTVLYANEMNLYPDIPKKAQYYYYFASLRKRKRRSKWFKLEENPNANMVQRTYNVRAEVAKQYLEILTEDDLKTIRDITNVDDSGKKRKK
jgi:hypothetical protein